MFNKNIFTQKDPIADLIKGINEADYKAKMEALKGSQHKLDKNKNNKLDADDFKILRGEKKPMKEEEQVEEGWDDMMKSVKDRAGPQPSGGSGMKQGSRYGGSKQKDKPEQETDKTKKEEIDPKNVTTDVLRGRLKGKSVNPFLSKKVMMDVPGDVNEEELDEAGFDALKHIKKPSPAVKAAAKDVKRGSYADRAALMKAGGVKDTRGPRGVTQEETELDEGRGFRGVDGRRDREDDEGYSKTKDADDASNREMETKSKAAAKKPEAPKKTNESSNMNERELSSGETAEKERIVKGMKKSLKGFKSRYGERAKEVMYATATKAAKKD